MCVENLLLPLQVYMPIYFSISVPFHNKVTQNYINFYLAFQPNLNNQEVYIDQCWLQKELQYYIYIIIFYQEYFEQDNINYKLLYKFLRVKIFKLIFACMPSVEKQILTELKEERIFLFSVQLSIVPISWRLQNSTAVFHFSQKKAF